jgi:AraC-like DNA-binding protein
MWSCYASRLTLSELSRSCATPESDIRHCLVQTLGVSPATCLRQIRVGVALQILTSSSLKVSGVAWSVGYRSQKDFYKALADTVGVRPAQARRECTRATEHAEIRASFGTIRQLVTEAQALSVSNSEDKRCAAIVTKTLLVQRSLEQLKTLLVVGPIN